MEATAFWVVWNEQGNAPMFKHFSQRDAEKEAERLARSVGGSFHVLRLVGTCKRNEVEWSHVSIAEDAPF